MLLLESCRQILRVGVGILADIAKDSLCLIVNFFLDDTTFFDFEFRIGEGIEHHSRFFR